MSPEPMPMAEGAPRGTLYACSPCFLAGMCDREASASPSNMGAVQRCGMMRLIHRAANNADRDGVAA